MKLMMLDDDEVCLSILTDACEAAGYVCEKFTEPAIAVKAYSLDPKAFDIVLTDMIMPDMNGIQVLKVLRQMNPFAVVIIISGGSDLATVVDALNSRAYGFFLKPLNIAELMKTLERAGQELEARQKDRSEQDSLVKEFIKLRKEYGEAKVLLRKYEALLAVQENAEE